MTTLVRGQNAPLGGAAPYTVVVTHDPGPEVDLVGFLLDDDRQVVDEDGMVFYNQPALGGFPGVEWRPPLSLALAPSSWPPGLSRVRIGLTLASGTFGAVRGLTAVVLDASGAVVATLDLGAPDRQNALIVGEIYRHSSGWKVRCVGDGFTDGLEGLARDAGIAIADEEEPGAAPGFAPPAPTAAAAPGFAPPPAAAPGFAPPPAVVPGFAPPPAVAAPVASGSRINLTKPAPDAPKIDLRKYEVSVALTKSNLADRTFRVVLAIDASGSMKNMYRNGTVQRSLERMVAIADILDDDGQMEVWFFGDYPVRSAPVTVATMYTYVDDNAASKKKAEGGNFEPRAMKEIMDWSQAEPSPHPTLVLFWSDGGVHAEKRIAETLVKSSRLPIYWMFLGLGRSDYGVLARLDDVRGGVVDNAGFIPIDDIDRYPDADLYGQIFSYFVQPWVAAATQAGIISSTGPR